MLQPRIPGLQHFFHATDIIRTVLILRLDSVFRFQQKSIHAFIEGLPLPGGNKMIPLQDDQLATGYGSCYQLCMAQPDHIPCSGNHENRHLQREKLLRINMRLRHHQPQHFLIEHRLFRKQRYQGKHQIPHNNGKLNGIFNAFGKQIGPV